GRCVAGRSPKPALRPDLLLARALAGRYAVVVWCRSLAGCSASRAALRRPSALLASRRRECCFGLAGRLNVEALPRGLERPRGRGPAGESLNVEAARPRALPLPGHEVDHAPDERGPAATGCGRPALFRHGVGGFP